MKIPKDLRKKVQKHIPISKEGLEKAVDAIYTAKKYQFYCHIKGRKVVFMDCFQCFESPSEDGRDCYIMDNAMKEEKRLK